MGGILSIVISILSILLLLVLIVGCCVVFTNAIEHLGRKLNLGEGAVGSIFAAIGTALPETIVPLVAIFGAYFSGSSLSLGKEIGVGAILGSPFLLTTLAMFVTGVAVFLFATWNKRSFVLDLDETLLKRDLRYFLCFYTVAVMSSFLTSSFIKYFVGAFLLVGYLLYAIRTLDKCADGACDTELEELYICKILKLKVNKFFLIISQIFLSIAALVYFSNLFVENIKFVSELLELSPFIISLLLAPIATELPEMFNSVLWVKSSKDTLAMANISGAIVFQSCIPMAIGLFFTSWSFSSQTFVNIVLVYLAVVGLCLNMIKTNNKLNVKSLLICGVFYAAYIIYVLQNVLKA